MQEIAVIVPTYNRAALLALTLQSILSQTLRPHELIVVDDGSKDDTESVVGAFGSAIRYLRIENSGEGAARNFGVANSSSPLIAFCDSDDLWHPDKLQVQSRLFDEVPGLAYSFTNFRTVTANQWSEDTKFDSLPLEYWNLPKRSINDHLFCVEASMIGRLLRQQPIFPSTLMMRRDFFDEVGRWNEPFGRVVSGDLEFVLRCAARPPIGVVRLPLVGIRKHASNFSGDFARCSLGEVKALRYALTHNPLVLEHSRIIQEEILLRSIGAAETAFVMGDFELMDIAIASIPNRCRSWRLRLKNLIRHCPTGVRRILQAQAVSLSTRLK